MDENSQARYRHRFGEVEFDESRLDLRVRGEPVRLEYKPLQILTILLRNPDEIVTREAMLDAVWQGQVTVDNVLANAISKLRKALGDGGGERIVTLSRIGYRLCGPVERTLIWRQTSHPK